METQSDIFIAHFKNINNSILKYFENCREKYVRKSLGIILIASILTCIYAVTYSSVHPKIFTYSFVSIILIVAFLSLINMVHCEHKLKGLKKLHSLWFSNVKGINRTCEYYSELYAEMLNAAKRINSEFSWPFLQETVENELKEELK